MAQKQGISQKVAIGDPGNPVNVLKPNADGSLSITGSVTAGTAFVPTGNATLAVSNVSARVALGSVGPTALITNTGSVTTYVRFGDNTVVATTSDTPIPAQQSIAFNVGANTNVAAIVASGTSNLTITTGTGIPSMAGGGSTGGGGSTTVKANAASPSWVEGSTTNPLSGDLHGSLRVLIQDSTGAPIDYTTPSPVTQSGTWNITNITGTVSLPTGAATEATLVKIPVAQGSTTAGQSGPLSQAAVLTSNPTYTSGQTSPLSMDTSGNLRVVVSGGGSNGFVAQSSTTAGQVGPLIQGAVTTAAPTYTTGQTNPFSLTTGGALRVDASAAAITAAQATAANLNAQVVGNIAGAGADSGNPVKVGGIYNSTRPTYTTGQRTDAQMTQFGETIVSIGGGAANTLVNVSFNSDAAPVSAVGLTVTSRGAVYNGSTWDIWRAVNGISGTTGSGTAAIAKIPNSSANAAVAPSSTTAVASNRVLKASAGNLYSINVVSGASAGYIMLFNATSLPADGAVTPARCWAIAANSDRELRFDPPLRLSTGITIGFSTTGPFTLTNSATAFIAGEAV